jgi:hypothetical protein
MSTDQPGHRSCPFCGVWMVVRKSDRKGAANDTFECALCRTVIDVRRAGERERQDNSSSEAHAPRA